jgi:hypothetical protein
MRPKYSIYVRAFELPNVLFVGCLLVTAQRLLQNDRW